MLSTCEVSFMLHSKTLRTSKGLEAHKVLWLLPLLTSMVSLKLHMNAVPDMCSD